MAKVELGGHSTLTASADSRFLAAPQFLLGAAIFRDRALDLEKTFDTPGWQGERDEPEHRALVIGALLGACSALEAEVSAIFVNGPGAHLGSDKVDPRKRESLSTFAALVEREPTLEKFGWALKITADQALERGQGYHQMADLLVKLRNDLTHYKPTKGIDPDETIVRRLKNLKRKGPPYLPPVGLWPYPLPYLSADLADWAVTTAWDFLGKFYSNLGVPSPFEHLRTRVIGGSRER